jgi:hypothetical protein
MKHKHNATDDISQQYTSFNIQSEQELCCGSTVSEHSWTHAMYNPDSRHGLAHDVTLFSTVTHCGYTHALSVMFQYVCTHALLSTVSRHGGARVAQSV